MKKLIITLLFAFIFNPQIILAGDFFIMGNGELSLKNAKKGQSIRVKYREGDNQYLEKGLREINRVYGSSYDSATDAMSLRFIEVLSYLQNHFQNAPIQMISGFRSLRTNEGLRHQGKMAASSSMHIEAAAADIKLEGVDILEVKEFANTLPCCGVGYYHGKHIHLDTGPKRWWDETNSGTEKKEPQENEKIIVLTKKDFYSKSEKIYFDFARISDYPFSCGVTVEFEKLENTSWKKISDGKIYNSQNQVFASCQKLSTREEVKNLSIQSDKPLSAGRYRIAFHFCEKQWSKMPDSIFSNEIEIR
ncbi:MAG: DUF882 domain-containing protein [Deltaproteobacteria bacterium]|nr:DUF882 domain-containing protein [Deltaproteobacteria bacterium]